MTSMFQSDPAILVLEDGTRHVGRAYGARGTTLGEVVFATGMTGYQETLTDPSYAGQIVLQTAPHIGNTGMNGEDPESRRIWVSGYIVRDPSRIVSNWRADESLDDALVSDGVIGISGIDTRAVTRHIRSTGSMRGGVFSGDAAALAEDEQLRLVRNAPEMAGLNLSAAVSVGSAEVTPATSERIGNLAVLDLGVKQATIVNLAARGFDVHVLPQDATIDDIRGIDPVAVFYSNGPGDPAASGDHVELLRSVLDDGLPFFGICFGNQLLGTCAGLGTYKLPFGHRGINQPVLDKTTGRVEITAHNHGFAVEAPIEGEFDSPNGYGRVEVSHVGLNDSVVEGLRALDIPAFSVQYHPEAAAGPHDANYLFDRFRDMVLANLRGGAAATNRTTERGADRLFARLAPGLAGARRRPARACLAESRSRSAPTTKRRMPGRRMPKRDDIKSVLVIGSGPIVIGQACEFDYSGTQACRVLREEGVRVILVNSNPATIMTDPDFADATYIEPISWQVIETIIAKEKPDAILPTLGGQTALNAAIDLHNHGILQKYDVELIGASFEAINKGEDRQIFKQLVLDAGADVADSRIAHSMDECLAAAAELGYPLVVRPSFTMGGLGSGFAFDETDLRRIAGAGLHDSPTHEVLLEESILGWKEYELELMRDTADNTVVVCSIENVDPVGVHTGDSITVAPALTLTDREYQKLRDIGIDIIRAVGVDTGGCNIQFAVDPATGRIIVIEMNPRVSRSSALASKATGFPIAKIAAKLAIGYRLDEIPNDITKVTPASFEPTLDYVVVKVPRFNFEKFPAADTTLTTTMKSVGEAMAIGRNYTTALQKALRSLEKRGSSFHWGDEEPSLGRRAARDRGRPTDGRIVVVQQALRAGATVEQLFEATGIDPWFLDQIVLINEVADLVSTARRAGCRDPPRREGARLQRRPGRAASRNLRDRGARRPSRTRPTPGVQDGGHLRGGVPRTHAVPLLELRLRDRGRSHRSAPRS